MAENKLECGKFREYENSPDSSEDSNEEEHALSESSDEGEYKLDSDSEGNSDSLQEWNSNLVISESDKILSDEKTVSGNETPSEVIPSAVLDKEYVYMPSFYENFTDREEWKSSGKWLLYVRGDLEKLDYLWKNLKPLLADDTLICLKASTGKDLSKGIVMCYTSNCNDKRAIKKAADAIQCIFKDDDVLYYKTNEASNAGLYNAQGDNFITKYMYTVAGSLYERDELNRWTKICFDLNDD